MEVDVIFGDDHYSPFLSRYVALKLEELEDRFFFDGKIEIKIDENENDDKRLIVCRLRSKFKELQFEEEITLNAKHGVDRVIVKLRELSESWPRIFTKNQQLQPAQ